VEVGPSPARKAEESPAWETCLPKRAASAATNGARGETIDPWLVQLCFPSPRIPILPALRDYAAESFPAKRPIVAALADLTERIHDDFKFDARATTVDTPLADVLRLRRGVCQDFAHLATGCLRSLGLAARYTSGYLRTLPPPGKPRLVGADAS